MESQAKPRFLWNVMGMEGANRSSPLKGKEIKIPKACWPFPLHGSQHDLLEIQSNSPSPGPEASCPPSRRTLHHRMAPLWVHCAFVFPEQTRLVQGAGARQLLPRPGAVSPSLSMLTGAPPPHRDPPQHLDELGLICNH